ncbi:MAG: amidohydrolase [Deferribacteres bacterium]|nr:amidohydrolase [candidate division KSB1 bacterium]MCB9503410.1 amidohydrolase [Deferribacteres bacterium]
MASISCSKNTNSSADLILKNARVWTMNPEQPWAQALAVKNGLLLTVGENSEVLDYQNANTEIIDAQGKLVVPGFIDSHVHFITGGFRLASVQLRDAQTPDEFAQRIGDFAKTIPAGAWITGGDWDHELWGGKLPQASWIDALTPENPVFVSRLDGHMALANSLALKMAGIDKNTPETEGGEIIRDQIGKPTGVLKDNAMDFMWNVMPDPPAEMKERALIAAMEYVAAQGVTSVHQMGGWGEYLTLKSAHDKGILKTRVYASVPLSTWEKLHEYIQENGNGDNWLKIGGLKGFVDGSLGSHTAAFFESYTDDPGSHGFFVNEKETLEDWILNADKNELQAIIHAIGDSAISTLIDIFEQVAEENGPRDRRFRIEHSQHIAKKDFARYAKNNIIASMQPYHAIDDGRWAEKVIGPERIKQTYAFRGLLDAGVKLAFGSDWFVAPPTPLEGIYAAVTRRTLDDKNPDGWVPQEKITVEEAVRAYTIDAAYASFEENIKGSLENGKCADFVILDSNIFEIAPEKIREVKILSTYVGGEQVFRQ